MLVLPPTGLVHIGDRGLGQGLPCFRVHRCEGGTLRLLQVGDGPQRDGDLPELLEGRLHFPLAEPTAPCQGRRYRGQPRPKGSSGHFCRQFRPGPFAAARAPPHLHLVFGHPCPELEQLHHLMTPRPSGPSGRRIGEGPPTMPADLGHHHDDFIYLLPGQQDPKAPVVAGLAAPFAPSWPPRPLGLGQCWWRVRRRRPRGVGGVLAETGAQFAYLSLQGNDQRLGFRAALLARLRAAAAKVSRSCR